MSLSTCRFGGTTFPTPISEKIICLSLIAMFPPRRLLVPYGGSQAQLLRELGESALEESLFGLLLRQAERALVRFPRVRDAAEPAAEIGAGGMSEVVFVQVAALEDGIDQREARRRAVTHRDRDGAIELDDRRGLHFGEHGIEIHDLR